jgi:hypothetical protein
MVIGQGLAGSRVGPDLRPVLVPVSFRIGRGVGGEDGAVEFLVRQAQLRGALVVEVGKGAFLEP